jgi:FtsH-binding integral membrane protein
MRSGDFLGSFQNQQFAQNQENPNKLAEEEYYAGTDLSGSARKKFVGKVYLLISLQLLLTTVIGYIAYNSITFKEIFVNTAMVLGMSVALLAISIVMACCTDFFRKYALPLFVAFTVLMSIIVGISICGYKSNVILTAAAITLLLTISLTIYACSLSSIQGKHNRI